ncbi:matrixin family metalloprotease [Bacillus pumilus]|uniref:matrixin family metalloprotease n=1 Tax=Bacillus pumilus TaxID=1408 RepID=UPI000D0289E1|nr:M12 family metallopeptidase [Bacillus pumilus]PRS59931.1 Tolloid-like protein 1 [Bacillus pumilus]
MTTNKTLNHCAQMRLPDDQLIEAARLAILENPDNAPEKNGKPNVDIKSYKMALHVKKKWSNGRILRVRFLDGEPFVHKKVKEYANQWSRYANIKFQFGNDPNAEIRISFKQKGYWSYLGTDNLSIPQNRATMNFEGFSINTKEEEFSRVVLHEFGHCIGLAHEQSSPGADIPWDKDAVYDYYAKRGWPRQMVDHNVLSKLDPNEVVYTTHDKLSIMQYPVPEELTIGDYKIGWNTTLSNTDKQFISKMYPIESEDVLNSEIEDITTAKVASLENDTKNPIEEQS